VSRLNELLAQEVDEWKRLSGQKATQQPQGNSNPLSVDTRRQIIIGGMVIDKFPELLRFEPRNNEAEDNIEFAPFISFLALLAADTEYVNRLKEQVSKALT
jgi:hypothetical protein